MAEINIKIKLASQQASTSLKQFENQVKSTNSSFSLFSNTISTSRRAFASFAGNLGANLASKALSSIRNVVAGAAKDFQDFETALVGVGKTTGLTGKELENLGKQVEELSLTIPIASKDLLGLAQTAAQLGISGTDNILKFTDTIARLGVSTDIVGQQGATSLAKIINVTGESVENVDKLSSSIVALGNTFATSESQILSLSREIAKGGARFGVTASESVGLAAVLSSLGVEAQVAGSTIQKVFSQAEKAIGEGGQALQNFSVITGLTTESFQELFKTDPTSLFIKLNEGLSQVEASGGNVTNVLDALGLADQRVSKTLGPLLKNTDELTRALGLQSTAYEENTALVNESAAAFDTTASDIKVLENTYKSLTNELVASVTPAIRGVLSAFVDFINFIKNNQTIVTAALAAITSAITLLSAKALFGAKALAIYNAAQITAAVSSGKLATASVLLSTGFTGVATAARAAWIAITGPVGLIVLGISAVVALVTALYLNWDKVRLATLKAWRAAKAFVGANTDALDLEIALSEAAIKLAENKDKQKKTEGELLELQRKRQREAANEAARTPDQESGGDLDLSGFRTAKQEKEEKEANKRRAEEEKRFQEEIAAIKLEAAILEEEARLLKLGEEKLREDEDFERLEKRLGTEEAIRQTALLNTITNAKDRAKALENIEKLSAQRKVDILKNAAKQEEEDAKRRISNLKSTLGTISSLTSSNNKVLFNIGKAAAISQAGIDGYAAVQKALASAPPPFNFVLAALVGAQAATNVSRIASQKPPGFQDGGIVGGNSFSGDRVPVRVNSGEMILNREQQANLFQQANGGGGSGENVTNITVELDGEVVGRAVSRQVRDGLELGEVS